MIKNIRMIIFNILLCIIIFYPLLMYIGWLLIEKKPMKTAIVDKTALTTKGDEHRSFNWVLRHRKYVKPDKSFYKVSKDYFGFFPKEKNIYEIHDFAAFNPAQIDSLSSYYDMVYITDMYGIYYNDWYPDSPEKEHSRLVYGGMDINDFIFLKRMKEMNKLIIMEFNCIGSPTQPAVRHKTEELFGLQWSGWTLRYFDSLDTLTNVELPQWVVRNYMQQHHDQWPFTKSGIVFVNENEQVFVLENETHLVKEAPLIRTSIYAQKKFRLPAEFSYPYWIDITICNDTTHNILATHYLLVNESGDSILNSYHVPKHFPAVIEHLNDYRFYYFAGDYCDNVIPSLSAYFRGVSQLKSWVVEREDLRKRSAFFWNYYYPLMTKILNDYYVTLVK